MLERLTLNSDPQFAQPCAIQLHHLAWLMDLLQGGDLGLFQSTPVRHTPLERAELTGLILAGALLAQPLE